MALQELYWNGLPYLQRLQAAKPQKLAWLRGDASLCDGCAFKNA